MGFLDWMRKGSAPKAAADPDLDPKAHGHRSWKDVYAEISADEGFAKARNETGREPETAELKIEAFWRPEPYKVQSSGYLVQACVGWSKKGYHAGLVIKPPNGEIVTEWGTASPTKNRAMAESYSAFSGWLERHEAQLDYAKKSHERSAPAHDR